MVTVTAPPGTNSHTTRRVQRTTDKLRQVVFALLNEVGYHRLTIDGVSAASGVAKTTIYRRWNTKADMVFELTMNRTDTIDFDHGTLRADLEAAVASVSFLIGAAPGSFVLPGLLADMQADPDLAARFRTVFVARGREHLQGIIDRAHARGELDNTAGVNDLHALLLGMAYVNVQLFDKDLDDRFAHTTLEQALLVLRHAQSANHS